MIWAVSASVNALDPDLENAAANCGAAPLHTFFTVTAAGGHARRHHRVR
jgi:putative spermidine/putrescine transport system permease protein